MNVHPKAPLNFTIKDNSYVIACPNIGQLWKIEELKAALSNGRYGMVVSNNTYWSEYSLDNIDMFAHLTALCPTLISDLKVTQWTELDPFDTEELKVAYKQQFVPWFESYLKTLKSIRTDDKSTDDKSTGTK